MKIKISYFFLTLIHFLYFGCASYQPQRFFFNAPINSKIPPLNVGAESVDLSMYERGLFSTFNNSSQDEASDLIRKDILENICEPSKNRKKLGYAMWNITNQNTKVNSGWFITSIMTLFSVNLIGYPMSSQTTNLELKLKLFDVNRIPLTEYTSSGEGTAYSAMWWGYSFSGAVRVEDDVVITRASKLKALSSALTSMKERIESNSQDIRLNLIDNKKVSQRRIDFLKANKEILKALIVLVPGTKFGINEALAWNSAFSKSNESIRVIGFGSTISSVTPLNSEKEISRRERGVLVFGYEFEVCRLEFDNGIITNIAWPQGFDPHEISNILAEF